MDWKYIFDMGNRIFTCLANFCGFGLSFIAIFS